MMLSSEVSLLDPLDIFSTALRAIEVEKLLLLVCRVMDRKVFGLLRHPDPRWRLGRRTEGMRHSLEAMVAIGYSAMKVLCFYPRPAIAYHTVPEHGLCTIAYLNTRLLALMNVRPFQHPLFKTCRKGLSIPGPTYSVRCLSNPQYANPTPDKSRESSREKRKRKGVHLRMNRTK